MSRFIECPTCGRAVLKSDGRCKYCGTILPAEAGVGAADPQKTRRVDVPPVAAPMSGGNPMEMGPRGGYGPVGGRPVYPMAPRQPRRDNNWLIYVGVAVGVAIVCAVATWVAITWSRDAERKEFVADSIASAQKAAALKAQYEADSLARVAEEAARAEEVRRHFVKPSALIKVSQTRSDYDYDYVFKSFGFGDVVRSLKANGYEFLHKGDNGYGMSTHVYALNAVWRDGGTVPTGGPLSVVTILANSERVWQVTIEMEDEGAALGFMRGVGKLGMDSNGDGYYGPSTVEGMTMRVYQPSPTVVTIALE